MLNEVNKQDRNLKREQSLDFLRGVAVLLMIYAHIVYFLFQDSNSSVNFGDILIKIIARGSNAVVFTLFLFVSGAVISVVYLKDLSKITRSEIYGLVKRSAYLLFGYYLVAFVAVLKDFPILNNEQLKRNILEILFLIRVPRFSEFILPFVFFSLSVIFLKPFYIAISKNIWKNLFYSLVLFIIAYLFYPLVVNYPWRELKALFVGDQGLIRFPLLQYCPVFFLGLYFGRILEEVGQQDRQKKFIVLAGLASSLILALSFVSSNLFPLAVLNPFNRWPPSLGFLAIGLSFIFLLYILYRYIPKPGWTQSFWGFINYLGRDAFDLYLVHIILLFLYEYVIGVKFANPLIIILFFFLLLFLSVIISSLNWKVSPSIFTLGPITLPKEINYRIKKRYILSVIIFNLVIFFNISLVVQPAAQGGIIKKEEIIGKVNKPLPVISAKEKSWFNENYDYYREITIKNTDLLLPLRNGETVSLSANLPVRDADSLIIVYYSEGDYTIIPFKLENLNTEETKIVFEIIESIYPNQYDNRYFLYYGSDYPIGNNNNPSNYPTQAKYTTELGEEISQKLLLQKNRRWFLKTKPEDLLQLDISNTISSSSGYWQYTYEIENTGIKGNINNYTAKVDLSQLPVGEYAVIVYGVNNQIEYKTRKQKIIISEPLLVSWTLDWEGWDVSDQSLDSLNAISDNHFKLPYTHFFNPRIYVSSVLPVGRSAKLSDWVKNRRTEYSDEIELHLHMQSDMLKEIGITPKHEPKWGYKASDGYDVLTTAYSSAEITAMLNWSKTQFNLYGLGTPIGYRAGGWFVDDAVLKALSDNGFIYDASGRDKIMWGGTYKSVWDLNSTSQPYYPSLENNNRFMEIPNNGGNTYEYKSQELINRFYNNFHNTFLNTKTAVVYMSHPQWQETDGIKMDLVLKESDKYNYYNDKGPVIYTTLKQIYELWR